MRFRSMKMSFLARFWRMSATTSSTGFWKGLRPQAAGTTQNSQAWTQPRVASKTSVVRYDDFLSRSRRGKGRLARSRSGAMLYLGASFPMAKSRKSCGQESSAYPVTTASAWGAASAGTRVTWGPPSTTGIPRLRKWAERAYARGAVPVITVIPTRSTSISSGMSSIPSSNRRSSTERSAGMSEASVVSVSGP
jgi:hypothetical protein